MIDITYKVRRNPYVMMNARYGLTIYLPQVVLTLMPESLFDAFKHMEERNPNKWVKISGRRVAYLKIKIGKTEQIYKHICGWAAYRWDKGWI